MKKYFPTVIDSSAKDFETIFFNGGKIGCQVEMPFSELEKIIKINLADVAD